MMHSYLANLPKSFCHKYVPVCRLGDIIVMLLVKLYMLYMNMHLYVFCFYLLRPLLVTRLPCVFLYYSEREKNFIHVKLSVLQLLFVSSNYEHVYTIYLDMLCFNVMAHSIAEVRAWRQESNYLYNMMKVLKCP